MAAIPESGFLLIADLTGYTAYLARGEIEHAPTIAGDLLETVIGRLEPPFRLAKFEGDAAFLWVEGGRAEGSLLLDAIEAAYVAFRRRLRSIAQATTCDCNACQRAARSEVLRPPRPVRAQPDRRPRRACRRVDHPRPPPAQGHDRRRAPRPPTARPPALPSSPRRRSRASGSNPQLSSSPRAQRRSSTSARSQPSHRTWRLGGRRAAGRRLDGVGQEPIFEITVEVDAPAAVTWAHLTSPALRPGWEGLIRTEEVVPDGRRGIGTTNRCVIGVLASLEEIVDWQPFEHAGYRVTVPDLGPIEATYDLTEHADRGSTTIQHRWFPAGLRAVDVEIRRRLAWDHQAALERLRLSLASISATEEQEEEEEEVLM